MRFVDEYRDEAGARRYVELIGRTVTRPWTLMEICGGQTHTFIKSGVDRMLPESLTLVHGPGCPVCVTPLELIDRALAIAARPEVLFTSFGDMLRVPGSATDLLSVKARGGDVRMVYSPLDAVQLAQKHPERQVVFFAVGFETTAPANAMAVWQAEKLGLANFSILCSHVLVPPAMEAILGSPASLVQGFLAAGHVCAVMGYREYEPLAARHLAPFAMILSFILFAAANMRGRLRRALGHPMLIGLLIWSAVHLLANGDRAGTVLFGAFFAYAAIDLVSAVRRHAVKAFEPVARHDTIAIVGGTAVALAVMTFHRLLFGVPVVPWGI